VKKFLFSLLIFQAVLSNSQDLKSVRSFLDTLCAPGMNGRGAVNKGDSIASEFIAGKFRSFGLKSFRPDYFQTFSFDINTFPGNMKLSAGKCQLIPGKDFIVDPASAGGKKKLRTYYLDTAIFTSENARKTFIGRNLKNKAIVYTVKDKSSLVNMPVEIVNKFNQSHCQIILEDKLTASLSTDQSPAVVFHALKSKFADRPSTVNFDVTALLVKNYHCRNIIGFVEGKVHRDSFVVVSAHYDHLGRMGRDVYFPGANDNASGVSMLLQLAEFYSSPENQPDFSIVFIGFGAEEAGLIGSHYFVENPLFRLNKIRFLINLDLLGTGDDGIMVVNGSVLPEYYDLLVSINNEYGYLKEIKKRGQAANSDHYFFYKAGVPAIFIYTLGGIAAYHDVYDVPATLPLTEFEDVFNLLKEFILRL
jgi:aminopeptidase YwaD